MLCSLCCTWFHKHCVGYTLTLSRPNPSKRIEFYCPFCQINNIDPFFVTENVLARSEDFSPNLQRVTLTFNVPRSMIQLLSSSQLPAAENYSIQFRSVLIGAGVNEQLRTSKNPNHRIDQFENSWPRQWNFYVNGLERGKLAEIFVKRL